MEVFERKKKLYRRQSREEKKGGRISGRRLKQEEMGRGRKRQRKGVQNRKGEGVMGEGRIRER